MRLDVRTLSKQVCIIVVLIGCIVLLGWMFSIESLKNIVPGLPSMKPNTALSFILAGAALWLWHQSQAVRSPRARFLSLGLSLLIIGIGATVLLQYIFNVDLGIDQPLFAVLNRQTGPMPSMRMSELSSISFLLLGVALILLWQASFGLAQILAFVSFLIAIQVLVNYFYQIQIFYNSVEGMALLSSITFSLLSLAMLFARPDAGWIRVITSPEPGGIMARRLLPVIIGIPLLVGNVPWFADRSVLPREIEVDAVRSLINILVLSSVTWALAHRLNNLSLKQQQIKFALRSLNEQLESKVGERTADLAAVNAQLRESYQLAQSVIEGISDPVFIKNIEGRYVLVNATAAKIIGRPAAEIIGKDDRELLPNISDTLMNNDRRIMELGQPQVLEEAVIGLNQTQMFLSSKSPWRDQNGSIIGIIGVAKNITDRKQAEERLRLSEERYRSLVEATANSVWITDAQGNIIQHASNWTDITGQIADIDSGWNWLKAMHPDDQKHVVEVFSHCLATGNLYELEFRVLSQTGEVHWLLAKGVPVYNSDHSIREWVGTLSDVTKQRAAEVALRQSENTKRAIIQAIPDLLIRMRDDGMQLELINKGHVHLIGDEYTISNSSIFNALPPDVAQERLRCTCLALQTHEVQFHEYPLIVDGQQVYEEARVVALQANEVLMMVRDITDRKQAELALEQLNQTLEHQVQERTAALTFANRELEAFSYSVSHDLRAPLRGIDGFSKALLDSYGHQLEDKAKHYLSRIRSGTQRMGELIDDILLLSKVTRAEMHCTTVNLSQVASEIASDLSETSPQRSVQWLLAPDITASGDKGLLRIVLENLLSNAWKFTSTQTHAEIRFGAIMQPNQPLIYFIQDNGVGFDINYASKLFTAFQRLHTEREFPGTGIGLAIVQRIILRHGGVVWAKGTLQQGATFYFTLEEHPLLTDTEV